MIDSMPTADLQQAVQLLKSNYINPEAVNETELARATLYGLLERIGPGVTLFAERAPQPNESTNPFFGEVIEGHIGYLRLGALTPPNLQALDASLQNMRAKKIDAAVIDLRASPATNDFTIAGEFAKRFVGKGKPLFTLRRASAKQERVFTNDRDPAYDQLMIVLADGETSGPAEVIAGLLRLQNKALVIGQPTPGQAVEFSDLPLNGGRTLRVAVAEAVLPDGHSIFPSGVKPDLPVEMPLPDKRIVFQQSAEKGMGPFIFEAERPHLNEAALLSGRNPELEAAEAAQRRKGSAEKPAARDPVLQRAVDVITSLAIFQQH
ncbi:MAG: S41 family peptidase [Verrucomicrobiota bacterium]|nr:S41 family peptidase [Verrucomicrobiota bacterium]